jgi:tRNA pseudouridine38-40 synthase
LLIRINANGFLRAMVRMIVGALLAINEHKYTKQTITDLLNKPHKGSAIHKAQACGLYLEKVYY